MSLPIENVVIIGSGPAGYTAATYAARANLKPFVFAGFEAGGVPGGQLMSTTEVENFPGFPDGITGPDLMDRMCAQARRWGAEIVTEDVISIDLSNRPFIVRSEDREIKAHTLIIATGATAKRLHLPSEETFWNAGISACAICDGATPIFRGAELAIIGGGDTAAEEALYLTKFASHVHLLVRRDVLRASKAMQDRLLKNKHITIHWNTEAVDVFGDERMKGLKVRNNKTNELKEIPARGLFYAVGHTPNTGIFKGQIELDSIGYIKTQLGTVKTSVEAVFAAGDVQDHCFRQAITAAGTGCIAAMLAEQWLSEHDLAQEVDRPDDTGAIEDDKSEPETVSEIIFDITATYHKGSDALRSLFNETDRLIVVKYASPSCGPCRALKPMLHEIISEFEKQVHYVEIDIQDEPGLAEAAGIVVTPTVQFLKAKAQIGEIKGFKKQEEYRNFISQNV